MNDLATIERLESELLHLPQESVPVTNKFAPGVYYREVFMKAGLFIIGKEHLTTHFNVVLSGRARVMMNGMVHDIRAPSTFISEPGVRKILYILEDMRWATIHPTNLTDVTVLENTLVRNSNAFISYRERNMLMGEEIKCHLP